MKKYLSLITLSLFITAGCQTQPEIATLPEATFNHDIVIINSAQLNQYWSPQTLKPVMLNKRPDWLPKGAGKGEYYQTIDSNGNEVSKTLISSTPEGWMTQALLNKMPKQQFKPTAQNDKRLPVKVKLEFEVKRMN
ncbi:hypothetical protein ACRN9Z_04810 [Shewanella frigidimarina]|jgi:hypothetical protein|uniref:Energy transducer TonB n=1 Tax=Shewanella frigidimarina (strain NCIMB 400) TaxID=318167 RepID=Q082Q3_SHEFN|nr:MULTISPECIES: hypothetical protein [Shewanella]MBB1381356.1 hypothetical protein [Shewanella sp. SR41-2]HBF47368.1 hypothetical protein [Shewanella frigidimarina]ABI71762.1 hypothetical protein Sfri_1916 [Shewanella frigidimarina NCIMB 400]MBB1426280.1 hypothetical protein [Shewanella sp. SG44-2]PKI08081.1 hypothetical protein CXF78_02240 [Shewanella sp. 11B5]|tara:strand:+ start:1071 stop:1478 length:408 start_codon:yes stop_codon:yes gene_type:complete